MSERVRNNDELFAQRYKGRLFRRKCGTVVYRAEAINHDTFYEQDYNFIHSYVRLRNTNTGRTVTCNLHHMGYEFVGATEGGEE